jgi:hypothetical protein
MGASGVVFGLFGLYITDIVMNFETVKRPLLQFAAIFTFLMYFILSMVHPNSCHGTQA